MTENCKYYKQKKQVSYNNGATYIDVIPYEYQKGGLIEYDSNDCKDYSKQYLTFEAIESGTFSFSGTSNSTIDNSSIQYSLDSGSTWNTLNRGVQSPTVSAGNKIYFKSSTLVPIFNPAGIGRFSSTGRFNIEGNIMSLFYGDDFDNQTSLSGKNYAFEYLFSGCTNLISAENLVLPATTLANRCYYSMFYNCTSLTKAPELPATSLANSCYSNMFQGCTSLTTAPVLPARTLANNCYFSMFLDCTSLTKAPELPATTLASYCYTFMFKGCTSLTKAPELPATSLASNCYYSMFYGCTSINYVKCLATDISAYNCTYRWLDNVSSTGTFVKNASMNNWTRDVDGIPSGWTIQNA